MRRNLNEWKTIRDDQLKSGLSITQYCKKNNIAITSFSSALKRMRKKEINIIRLKSEEVISNSLYLYLNDKKVVINYDNLNQLEMILGVIKNV